jgi:hypothetical protein
MGRGKSTNRAIRMKDIAKDLGVSVITVPKRSEG